MKLKALLLATAITTAIPVPYALANDKYGTRPYLTVSSNLSSSWSYQVSNTPSRRKTWGVGKHQPAPQYRGQRYQQPRSKHHRQRVVRNKQGYRQLPQQRKTQYHGKPRRQKVWKATGIFAGLANTAQPQTRQTRRGSVQFITRRQSHSQRQFIYQHNSRQTSRQLRIDQPRQIAHAPQYDHNRAQAYIARETARRGVDPAYLPATVSYESSHAKGTIIINTQTRYLYLILGNGKARRFGVGVGKAGFEWSGSEKISRKAEWPSWRPPSEMIARERAKGRDLPVFMEGGPANPLGARALYLGSTLYRIHGTNQPWSIGQAVSSGCIRMRNEDVIELYERVPIGAKVIVS